ncbi:unnamed protein product [Ostreobium quekettii]|uniref:L-aspartate oxidase n=1 Tax=Ostreobium quekettii TaxID=121088 RepID=A0A8S1IWI7_9CHLO|nr:unnamed protein product [Ostreobium quekettii]
MASCSLARRDWPADSRPSANPHMGRIPSSAHPREWIPGAPAGIRMPRSRRLGAMAPCGRARRSVRSLRVAAVVNWEGNGSGGFDATPQPASLDAPPAFRQYDFAVVGSGIAGLTYALKVAEYGSVAVITKAQAEEGCTRHAQGGISAVLGGWDSVEEHVRDTMVAGAFLNNRRAVEVVCREGPARVMELVRLGTIFSRNDDGSLHLTREGGHSSRRVVHAADATGAEVERALLAQARANSNIDFFEHHLAVDLVVDEVGGVRHCLGVDVLDQQNHSMCRFIALSTMLATGGAGQVYPHTTNPSVSTGDGIAVAYRARARVANMEFVQFHPTSLFTGGKAKRSPLISEAVRGEGGLLFNSAGRRFMLDVDRRGELAPRDIVARAIQEEMLAGGDSHVLLDISHKPAEKVLAMFPNIAARCQDFGIDITKEPIPVVPAQHYMCGGVQTGLLAETSIQGLYACGEVSSTGLHGANRLASNSLLEGLVFAHRAAGPSVAHAEHALKSCSRALHYAAASAEFAGPQGPRQLVPQAKEWVDEKTAELRALMWDACGIVRTREKMKMAASRLAEICVETKAFRKAYGVSTGLLELLNMATVGELVVFSALQRKESRGGHYVAEYPETGEKVESTIISTSLKRRCDLSVVKRSDQLSAFLPTVAKKGQARDMAVRSSSSE